MRARVAILAAASLLMWFADHSGAYSTTGRQWPSGSSIVMHLEQAASSGTLMDGSADWNAVTEGALSTWNSNVTGVSFRVTRDSDAGSIRNGINNVIWADDMYGDAFGDAIAVTISLSRNNVISEADVLFDRARKWNSYRGNLRAASGGGTLIDMRRVALHEFGHVLGLGHPDQQGQTVSAIINSRISNVDSLQSDDTNGARAIYGGSSTPSPSANRSPTVTATCNPSCTVQTGQTTTLVATASDPDGDSLSYQWTAPLGSFSSSTIATTVYTATAQTGTVTATITVQDGRGGSATATVTLQVVPRDILRAGARLLPGQALTSSNGRYRLVCQVDGNLVLYDDVDRTVPWSNGTAGTAAGQAVLQADGNFVVYDAKVIGIWSTGTAGNSNAFLALQSDGNLVLYGANGQPLWVAR